MGFARNLIYKINLKYLFYTILISIILWICLLIFSTSNYSQKIIQIADNSKLMKQKIKKVFRNDCEPIYKENKQYTVEIDGQIYPKIVYLYQNKSINFDCLNRNNNTKTISIRTPILYNQFFDFETGVIEPFKKTDCPVTNCEFTNDVKKLNKSQLVLFEMNSKSYKHIPDYRLESQRYVFVLFESPANSPDFSRFSNFFNLTATYESDSDFPGFYLGWKFNWQKNDSFNDKYDYFNNKFKFAAAVISNCNDKANRLKYLNELRDFIPVDIFGRCGELKCPRYYTNTSVEAECKRIIAKDYKFFLAFENSVCKDYITEKFFYILEYDIIPVVRGGGSTIYDHYIPKSGYIDAFDFKSAQHLAEYLIYLANNKTAYNSYFKWKKHVNFYKALNPKHTLKYNFMCDMCIQLHLEDFFGIKSKIIVGNPHKKYDCKNYSSLFEIIIFFLVFFLISFDFILMKKFNKK